jgi:hypothetical protein
MSCLFDSLSVYVNMNSGNLRNLIVNYLKTNPKLIDDLTASDIIKWTENCDLNNYTNRMNNENAWGGAIEIRAFCELFSVNVTVHVLYTNKQFEICTSQKPKANIHISYTGTHFEPMYKIISI